MRMTKWKKTVAAAPVLAAAMPASPAAEAALSNPLYVPPVDREFLWNQIVDTVDNYFRIARERRVQDIGSVLTDGQIDTLPTTGSTLLEPWRKDSTSGYERRYATLQSVRRQAFVSVVPDHQGYFVQVIVKKDLEAVDHPEHSSVGTSTIRHDNSLVSRHGRRSDSTKGATTIGWIPKGRDTSLEQQMLQEIRARVASFQKHR